MAIDPDLTLTSRARLLAAGKELFAKVGYEQASTAAIARAAGTSESQLVRYFDGKAGLLEAVFNESWRPLIEQIQSLVAASPNARQALLDCLSALTKSFAADPEVAFLFLFEGRRLRGPDHEISLSKGYVQFAELVRALIRRGQQDGSFSPEFSAPAAAAAVIGGAEGMVRERLLAERAGKSRPFSDKEVRRVFAAFLEGLGRDGSASPADHPHA